MNCRLCDRPGSGHFFSDRTRDYFLCPHCDLVFVPEAQFVAIDDELRRYARHDNTPDHEGYCRFLSGVVDTVRRYTAVGGRVLDFGSGKHAVLTSLLRDAGYACTAYDPLYAIGPDALQHRYDTVVLCEVIEHLRDLQGELAAIGKVLRGNGMLIVRTNLHPAPDAFAGWWYKNDPTHINFLGERTAGVIARRFGYDILASSGTVTVFRRCVEEPAVTDGSRRT